MWNRVMEIITSNNSNLKQDAGESHVEWDSD